MIPWQAIRSPTAVTIVAVTGLCAVLLVAPATTVSTKYFNDLLVFLDGGYRTVLGQVPSRDFHTALGPLAFYLPGFGFWLSGRLSMAMPLGMAALLLVTAPIMIHVLQTRLRPLIAIPTAMVFLLLLAAPYNTGEPVTAISFAMFYNRIGWVLLGVLLIMHLMPERPGRWQAGLDTAAASVLTLLLLYTKISYGLVATAFLVLMLLQQNQRHWAGASLLCVLAGVGLTELFWGGTLAHIDDLTVAANVSGARTVFDYLRVLTENLAEYAGFAFIASLALYRTRELSDFLFYGFCAGAGLALIIQNFQSTGVVTLLAGAAVAAELLARNWRDGLSPAMDIASRGSWLVAIVLMLPVGLASATALGLHTALAVTKSGTNLNLPNAHGLRVAETVSDWDYELYRDYADTLEAGGKLLQSLEQPASKVLVMDFASPFTSLLGLEPPGGGPAWMHDGRNFDDTFHIQGENLFADINVVMIPKDPIAEGTTELMREIYGDYLDRHFKEVSETGDWLVLQRGEARNKVLSPGKVVSDLQTHPVSSPERCAHERGKSVVGSACELVGLPVSVLPFSEKYPDAFGILINWRL